MEEVAVQPVALERIVPIIGPARAREFTGLLAHMSERLRGRTLWSVNSTAQGGGVAEILSSVLSYLASAGINVRWLALDGNDAFFRLTKDLHHLLHGDGVESVLGEEDRRTYETTLSGEAPDLLDVVAPGDPVVLHDPQTLGLAPSLTAQGALVIWCCHVGADRPNRWAREAWTFLGGYLGSTERQVFSRPQYVWEDAARAAVIPPCVDALSSKNKTMDRDTVNDVLAVAGLLPGGQRHPACIVGKDGSAVEVLRRAEIVEEATLEPDAQLVTQVSRWDPLKDHPGVMHGFSEHVATERPAHLVLAGPAMGSVNDDPEERSTFDQLVRAWGDLPRRQRARVHIVSLPMDDPEENALMVNALQRRSDVIVQKSLAEGFGLTVAEAMWKGRPTVGSRVGGVQDQIVHGESGLLLDDPADLKGLGSAVVMLLDDHDLADRVGRNAIERVRDEYLAPSYLARLLRLVDEVLQERAVPARSSAPDRGEPGALGSRTPEPRRRASG